MLSKEGGRKSEDNDNRTFCRSPDRRRSGRACSKCVKQNTDQQHRVFKKRPQVVTGYAPWRVVHAKGVKTGYPGASSYPPSAPKDYTYDNSRKLPAAVVAVAAAGM